MALVVALAHAATEPDLYRLWYAGASSLLVLLVVHWSGTNRVGRGALVVITLLAFLGPAYSLRQSSLLPSIESGNIDYMAVLLRFGADVNRLEQHDRPLIAAVEANRPDLMEMLLQAGADPDGRTSVFMNYGPVLIDAARMADSRPLRLLLRYGANPNLTNNSGETAIFHAARWGRRLNVEALLANGARPEINGQQALDAAQDWDNGAQALPDKEAIIQMLRKAGGTSSNR